MICSATRRALERMAQRALAAGEGELSWSAIARRTLELYRSLGAADGATG